MQQNEHQMNINSQMVQQAKAGMESMWFIYYPDMSGVEDLPFYTVSIGLHVWQWPVNREEGYPYPQFLYSWQGRGRLTIEGRTREIPARSILFLPAGVPHHYEPLTDIWDIRWFVPAGSGVAPLLERFGFNEARIFPIASLAALDDIHGKIHMAFQRNTEESIFFSASYTYEFLFEFYKQYCNQTSSRSVQYRKRLVPVLEYIEHHLAEQLTQAKLCELIQVSPQHLCRMFHECVAMRPMEYIAKIRVAHACEMLINTQESIENIAYAVGFNNANYFGKIFRRHMSMTPGEYRLRHRIAP